MYEVELKIPADHPPVREQLADLDAEPLGAVRQVDTYYDAPDRSFADTDEALRIRRERRIEGGIDETDEGRDPTRDWNRGEGGDDPGDQRAAMTYKGPKVDDTTQTREEHETGVTDPDAAAGLLEGLGYEPAARVGKRRRQFDYEGATVTLDAVDGLGTFVEVDIEVDGESAVPAARDRARALLDELGLDPEDGIRESYLELVLAAE